VAADTEGGRVKPGRRPGNPDTRAAIVQAAKGEFSNKGFDRTSFRGIAKAAGVDPALVHHYFAAKDDLLLASLEIPFDPRQVIPLLTDAGVAGLGMRIISKFLSIWDDDELRPPLIAIVNAATTSEAAAELMREGIVRIVLEPISAVIESDDAAIRAQCVASQLLGVIMARYVLRLEPLASLPADELAPRIAVTLQGYLDGNAEALDDTVGAY
jgi:AcrR family transcriptional regulator